MSWATGALETSSGVLQVGQRTSRATSDTVSAAASAGSAASRISAIAATRRITGRPRPW